MLLQVLKPIILQKVVINLGLPRIAYSQLSLKWTPSGLAPGVRLREVSAS